MRTKNLEYNLLVLEILLEYYEKNHVLEMRREKLFDYSDTKVLNQNKGKSGLGKSAFSRVIKELEEEMAIKVKKVTKGRTIVEFNLDRVKKMINNIKYKQGPYREGIRLRTYELEASALRNLFQQVATSILDNYQRPWISNIDDKSQYAFLIAQRCASKVAAILMASRFSFILSPIEGSSLQSMEKPDLLELLRVTSRFASKHLDEPFKLLIEYSGLPQSDDWGLTWKMDLWHVMIIHFEEFAKRLFNFNLNQSDLTNLEKGSLDNLSPEARRLFNIFHEDYVLPTIRAMASKNIKFQ